jgi:hypothetical protein
MLWRNGAMSEARKLAAILCADVVGYSRLAGADEDRILARLRALRSDLIDPMIAVHHGRIIERTGDGSIVEFRSVVDAVRCAIEVQNAMVERNAGVPPERLIVFRIGIHLGDVIEESDGDLMGDGINIAARRSEGHRPTFTGNRYRCYSAPVSVTFRLRALRLTSTMAAHRSPPRMDAAPHVKYTNDDATIELPDPGLQQRIAKNPTCGRGSNPFSWRIMIWIDR